MDEADRKAFEEWGNTKTEWYPDKNMDDTALGMSLAAEDSWSAGCIHKDAQHKKEMDEAVNLLEKSLQHFRDFEQYMSGDDKNMDLQNNIIGHEIIAFLAAHQKESK